MKSDERLLTDIVGGVSATEHSDDRCRHGAFIALDKRGERSVVASARLRDEIGVGSGIRYGTVGQRGLPDCELCQGIDNRRREGIPSQTGSSLSGEPALFLFRLASLVSRWVQRAPALSIEPLALSGEPLLSPLTHLLNVHGLLRAECPRRRLMAQCYELTATRWGSL
jgi:hypothetical protein